MAKHDDKEWLEKMYVDKKLSTRQIGEISGCSNQTIGRRLNKFDIETRDHKGENNPMYNIDPSDHPMYGIRGEDHHAWKGGHSPDRKGPKVDRWRRDIFERDAYTCQDCGETNDVLNAHHIERWSEAPDKRYDRDNGITLCIECHAQRHEGAGEEHIAMLIRHQ